MTQMSIGALRALESCIRNIHDMRSAYAGGVIAPGHTYMYVHVYTYIYIYVHRPYVHAKKVQCKVFSSLASCLVINGILEL